MPPDENPLAPFRAQELLADKIGQDLTDEDFGQPRFVDPRDLIEETRLVHSALGDQEMEVRMRIDAVAEGLNGRNDSGPKLAPGYNLVKLIFFCPSNSLWFLLFNN
jgi:hypothetical protein